MTERFADINGLVSAYCGAVVTLYVVLCRVGAISRRCLLAGILGIEAVLSQLAILLATVRAYCLLGTSCSAAFAFPSAALNTVSAITDGPAGMGIVTVGLVAEVGSAYQFIILVAFLRTVLAVSVLVRRIVMVFCFFLS